MNVLILLNFISIVVSWQTFCKKNSKQGKWKKKKTLCIKERKLENTTNFCTLKHFLIFQFVRHSVILLSTQYVFSFILEKKFSVCM